MARFTFGGKLGGDVIWVRSLIIIIGVAAVTKVRGIDIVSLMAGETIVRNTCMSTLQGVIVIMNRECGRLPVGIGGMAGFTGIWDANGSMVRVDRLAIINLMTFKTNRRRTAVSVFMTEYAIGC